MDPEQIPLRDLHLPEAVGWWPLAPGWWVLIALAVAHAVQCPYCIDAFTQSSLENGSNVEEMTEAVHVAAAIRGGAALVHGVQMKNKADQLQM